MRRLALTGAAIVALLIAVAVGAYFWPTDGRRILVQVMAAANAVSIPEGEDDVDRAARVAGLTRILAPDVVLDAGPYWPSMRGRDSIVSMLSGIKYDRYLSVYFMPSLRTIHRKKGRATVDVLVRTVEDVGSKSVFDGTELHVELVRLNGEWLISRITRAPTLTR